MIKNEIITDQYALYNSDCNYVLPSLPDNSVDLSVYSPPFMGLYNYSSSPNDFSNCDNVEQFLTQYEFLVKEKARITKPGRISAVHCADVLENVTANFMFDFPHEIIKLHEKHGFRYVNRITVWKEPLKVRMRTMVRSLMHKLIVEDSTQCFTAMPDYVLIFKRSGDNKVPVTHPFGLTHYAGARPLLDEHLNIYGAGSSIQAPWNEGEQRYDMGDGLERYVERSYQALKEKYHNWPDPRTNKLSHIIWQRYASSVWDDIRNDEVLKFQDAREDDDEKHVHPLQLDIIDRIVELYSNPGEVVLTSFMGVGSEVFSPVSMGRYGIGIELKESYYKQAIRNLSSVSKRFAADQHQQLSFV